MAEKRLRKTRFWIDSVCGVILILSCIAPILTHKAYAADGDGMLLYAAASNTTPQTETYHGWSNSFDSAAGTVSGTQPNIVQLKSSPTKKEFIAGYEDTSGNLQIICYDGSSWSNEWSVTVGGTGTTRRFDIAYETNTGDVTVAYSRNTAATNALAYRTKAGSTGCGSGNWSSATNFPTGTSVTTGTVQWVKAARDSRSGSVLDTFIWADSNSDLGAAIWSGSAFTDFKSLETSLEVVSAAQDVDDFEVQYESMSGDIMVVWAQSTGTNGIMGGWYDTCPGGTSSCTWGTAAKIWTQAGDDATNLDLSADPTSDEMAFASIGNAGSDLQAAYWSGSAWTRYANQDTSCETPIAGSRKVQTGWVTNNGHTQWIETYDDSTGRGLSWYAATPGSTPVKQTDFTTSPLINDIRERYQVDMNPFDSSKLMLLLTDSTTTIIAEQLTMDTSGNLTWSDASAPSGLGTTQSVPPEGFSFQYYRYTPGGSLSADIVDGSGGSVGSPSFAMSGIIWSFSCATSTGTLGDSSQRLRFDNGTGTASWSASIAATGGNTTLWSSGSAFYDFNDPTGSPPGCSAGTDSDVYAGQLTITPPSAAIAPQSGCSTTGLSLGSQSAFNEGVTDAITLLSADASADVACYWDVTGIDLSQQIPAEQPTGSYQIGLTLTIVAN